MRFHTHCAGNHTKKGGPVGTAFPDRFSEVLRAYALRTLLACSLPF